MSQNIHGEKADYAVLKLVGRTSRYNVYIVTNTSTGEEFLMKISPDPAQNGLLDREAFILRELHDEMKRRDEEFKRAHGVDKTLGYHRCFPRLEESILVPEQGNRRVNIIAIYGARSMTDLVPLEQWRTRARERIDPKSSAWIMGRLLKILTLTHPMGVSVGTIDGGNILVNPQEHHVALFDWTGGRHHEGLVPHTAAREEISQAATAVVLALGGNPETGELPASEQLPDSRYAQFLKRLVDSQCSDPMSTGAQFYKLLDTLWEPGFHPFTTTQL